MNRCLPQSGLGYTQPVSGGLMSLEPMFIWGHRSQLDTKSPFVGGAGEGG